MHFFVDLTCTKSVRDADVKDVIVKFTTRNQSCWVSALNVGRMLDHIVQLAVSQLKSLSKKMMLASM